MHDVRWTTDLAVSGIIDWNQVNGHIEARVSVAQDDGLTGALDLHWDQNAATSVAIITGSPGRRDSSGISDSTLNTRSRRAVEGRDTPLQCGSGSARRYDSHT